jgi:hypothetical protein
MAIDGLPPAHRLEVAFDPLVANERARRSGIDIA